MKKPFVIIVNGPPGTGKTTLGQKIAEEFQLPFFSKDKIKHAIFDSLGVKDLKWSMQIGAAAYKVLYNLMSSLLSAKVPFVVESNFDPKFDDKNFIELKKENGFFPIQIMCKTDGKVLFERFKQRAESGNRHPGHAEHLCYNEFKGVLLKGYCNPLNIGGKIIEVDTTDFRKMNHEGIYCRIRKLIGSA